MKMTPLAIAVAASFPLYAQAEIMITEYVEGSGNNKAIELYNSGESAIDLSSYTLSRYKDGDETPTEMVALSGTLNAGELLVVYNSSADFTLGDEVNSLASSTLYHNGGDAVGLFEGDSLVDVVGDVPTESGWGKEETLRKESLTAATTYDASQWQSYDQDTFDGLGNLSVDVAEEESVEGIETTIMAIQGSEWSSPLIADGAYESEDYYQVTGVVTAIQTTALGNDIAQGFFIQDIDGDGDATTSDGLFVESDSSEIALGNTVTVTGKAYENYGWTQLIETTINAIEETQISVEPIDLAMTDTDESFSQTLERHEGMLIRLDAEQEMRVTRTYGFDYDAYRYNMVAAYNRVNLHPNQDNVPGSDESAAQAATNADYRLFIESFEDADNGVVPWYPDFLAESAVPMADGTTTSDDYIRVDDTIDGLEGVLGYSYSEYRLYVTNEATSDTFIHNNDRTTSPEVLDGDLRVATFNVLNYFNSPFGGAENPYGDNRGAESEEEFSRQGTKIAKAIVALDADIVGLMEIENNGFDEDSAIADLVSKINALIDDESEQYAYISSEDYDYIGTDAITNNVIFKPSVVTLDTFRVIAMPEQHATEGEDVDNYQRDAITPTFEVNATGDLVTVSVNHFKSKGSTCWEDVNLQDEEDADNQGSCENLRVSAAQHLGEQMALIDGYKLIMGDLNSYASEDPILLLTELPDGYTVTPARDTFVGEEAMDGSDPEALSTAFGYVNVIKARHPESYSYSYDDYLGTLDYILADSATASVVIDAIDWNINASESTYVDYTSEYSGDLTKYEDLYRSSDHDPAVVVLSLSEEQTAQPVNPPSEPINPPAGVEERPTAASLNEPLSVLFDLTVLGDFQLHTGDSVILTATKQSSVSAFAATEEDSSSQVTLTEALIEQGWVSLSTTMSEEGDYTLTKQISGTDGDYDYETATITVADTTTTATESSSGGSAASSGLWGLVLMSALALWRRRQ